jgi:hypothetical protein
MKLGLAMAAVLAMGLSAHAQEVQFALDGAADLSPVYPLAKIPANARQVVAIFTLSDQGQHSIDTDITPAAPGAAMPADSGASIDSYPVVSGTRILFRHSFHQDLPVGAYRLAITVDDKPWAAQEFEVVPAAAPLAVASSLAMLGSLSAGTEWDYEVRALQKPRPGMRVRLPGAEEADPDGWLRTKATRKVVALGAEGVRVDTNQGGELIGSAWLVPTDKGILVAKFGDPDPVAFLPPMPTIARPGPVFHMDWKWVANGKRPETATQFQMWGPLPIATPKGEAPGYVVLRQTPDADDPTVIAASAETRIVPGIGVVAETDILAIPQYQTASRTEYRLTAMKPGAGAEPDVKP